MITRLKDKVILVTGSTTGIGEAIARRCVAEGARVLVHGRDEKRGREVVESLGASAVFHPDDLSDPDAAERLIDAVLKAFGRLDGLVNNAAWVPLSTIESTDTKLFDQVMAINVRAPLLLVQRALEPLSRARGCVLNIGSINAHCGEAKLLVYSVSKGALTTLTRNLSDSLLRSHGVRVNQINPGWVLTPNEIVKKQEHGLPPDWHLHLPKDQVPTGKLLDPEVVAAAAVYLLGDESWPVTGSVVELEQFPMVCRNPSKGD